ncbi:MAG: hypothetical protein GY719_14915 [bacterium]|nr:hypothetical protein [bacterium]
MKSRKFLYLLLPWLVAAPVFASGTVYVPFAGKVTIGDMDYQTWVWTSNGYPEILGLAQPYFIPTFTDGTQRDPDAEPNEVWMSPGQTKITVVDGQQGMLEVFAATDVYVHARLVPVGEDPASGQGIDLPVVTSDNMIPAGGTARTLGWERKDDGAKSSSNWGLINLGHQPTDCLVDIVDSAGEPRVTAFPLSFEALSHNQFGNVMSILGQQEASDWRISVTCDQPFYHYLSIYYPETGRVAFVGPAGSGMSDLQRPNGGTVASDQFEYLSDLPIDDWGGLEIGPFVDSSGIDFHASGGPVGGYRPILINGVEYQKGIAGYPRWNQTSYVEFQLGGNYALFTTTVRLDDQFTGRYEWAIVNTSTDVWEELQRPSDGFNGVEHTNPIRVGGAATFQIIGDGQVIYQGPEVYAYGEGHEVSVDVSGINVLRLQLHPDGTEQLNAPHRNGLDSPRLVKRCPWLDLFDFADAKLFLPL